MMIADQPPICYWGFPASRKIPDWLPSEERIMISAGALWDKDRKVFRKRSLPKHAGLFLDSGGFTCLNLYGDYPWSREQYLELIREIQPDLAAIMDYPCEPDIRRGDKFVTNLDRIEATLANTEGLLKQNISPQTTILPVIQGYTTEEYQYCIKEMSKRGLFRDYMAVGSMCRRWNPKNLRETLTAITKAIKEIAPTTKLHWFGLKITALKDPECYRGIFSFDTQAWSLGSNGDTKYPHGDEKERFFSYREKIYQAKAKMLGTNSSPAPAQSVTIEELAYQVPVIVRALMDRHQGIREELEKLEHQGITEASPHWRAGKYLYLIHPTQKDGTRKREYIGNDSDRVNDALAMIDRSSRYKQLIKELTHLDRQLQEAEKHLQAFYTCLNEIPMATNPYDHRDPNTLRKNQQLNLL